MSAAVAMVVGVDGSADSHAAIAWAASFAERLGASVLAVHAVGLLEHQKGDPSGSHLLPLVEEWSRALDALPGDSVRRRLLNGEPVSALLRVVEEEHADLLVVGTRGAGAHADLGSTSHQLAASCPCALVIVPAPA